MKDTVKKFIKARVSPSRYYLLSQNYKRVRLFFKKNKREHIYLGFPLKICIGDDYGRRSYDHDWLIRNEIEFLRQGKLKPGAGVYNLGANQCVVGLILSRIAGEKGLVVAVEMDAFNCHLAQVNKRNNRADNLRIIHAAAAQESGAINFDGERLEVGASKKATAKLVAVSLDDLIQQYCPPAVLYMDVEGYEANVLKGAKKALQFYPDCCIEVHVGCGLERYHATAQDILTYFPEDKYRLYIGPVSHNCNFVPFEATNDLIKQRFYLLALSNHSPANYG